MKKKTGKKKRSAKQLANDRRLGRMAKARAGAARKKKTARKKARRPAARNPIPTSKWFFRAFRCRGRDVQFLSLEGSKITWTKTPTDAVRFMTKAQAAHAARTNATSDSYQYGVSPDAWTAAKIAKECSAK